MKRIFLAALIAAGLNFLPPGDARASGPGITPGQDAAVSSMREFDETRPPIGYVDFCERNPNDCKRSRSILRRSEKRPQLTDDSWAELVAINRDVNAAVVPVTDLDQYDQVEYWTYPQGWGDCEDYVLAKRRILLERGWPASSLLITVVRDEQNLGHAVLTVTTSQGDFVLDNKTSDIRAWIDTPYVFHKRQSRKNPLQWISLTAAEGLRLRAVEPVASR